MEITSKQNTYIKEYRKLTEQRKYRRQTGYFVCEGAKLAVEAVKSGAGQSLWENVCARRRTIGASGRCRGAF